MWRSDVSLRVWRCQGVFGRHDGEAVMRSGALRTRALGFVGVFGLLAGALSPTASAAAANRRGRQLTCPTVDPATHAVTPARTPGVDWSGCGQIASVHATWAGREAG
jgi:hypothetical protein